MLTRSEIKEILLAAGLRPKKRWGQVFITNRRVLVEMAEAGLSDWGEEAGVFEFGGGLGNLTRALAERAGFVLSVEVDPGLHSQASRLLRDLNNVLLVCEDGIRNGRIREDLLKIFLETAKRRGAKHYLFASNIPYAVSGVLLVSLAMLPEDFSRAVIMCQKEVADRVEAAAGSKNFSPLSVLLQRCYRIRRLFNVPPNAFYPKPDVTSAVLRLDRKSYLPPSKLERIFGILNTLFAMRRKTLYQNLRKGFGLAVEDVERILSRYGLHRRLRSEEVEAEVLWEIAEGLQ